MNVLATAKTIQNPGFATKYLCKYLTMYTWKSYCCRQITFLLFLKIITHLKFELTSEWKRPHVSNLTAKSKGSAASPSCTVLLQLVSWAWPLTYITPWKLGSDTLTVTETPSAKQLTIISGRGKSLGGGLGLGMGTRKKGTWYYASKFKKYMPYII